MPTIQKRKPSFAANFFGAEFILISLILAFEIIAFDKITKGLNLLRRNARIVKSIQRKANTDHLMNSVVGNIIIIAHKEVNAPTNLATFSLMVSFEIGHAFNIISSSFPKK